MKQLFFVIGTVLVLSSCSNNTQTEEKPAVTAATPPREECVATIKKMEEQMFKAAEVDNATANLALEAYTNFVSYFPEDTLAPECLFKAGEVATASKKYKRAMEFYQTITSKYNDYKHAPESLYLQGFLYDNFLNDNNAAKEIYNQVIAKYPNTAFAKDAQSSIGMLGKTDEQIIEELKKKNEKKK